MSRFAVLISGGGTNLQALIDAAKQSDFPGEIALVISNKRDAFGLVRAEKASIPHRWISHRRKSRQEFEDELIAALQEQQIEWVVLAGFMRILSPHFVEAYQQKILNIHPALLPAFPGLDGVKQAFDYGVWVAGATVHFVDTGTDTGPIVIQGAVPVSKDDDEASLKARVLQVEHCIFPIAVGWALAGKLSIVGRRVMVQDSSEKRFVWLSP